MFAAEAIGGAKGMLEGNAAQLGLQAYGVAVTVVYCAIATFILLKVVDAIVGLRVDKESERDGLDLNLHGETVQ